MKTLIRFLILLLLVVWVGALAFFPITAWMAFSTLPTHHMAGTVTGESLRILYTEGLVAGILLVVFLLIAQQLRAFARNVIPAVVLVLIMLGLTAYSQFSIIPRMESYRIQAGGAVDQAPVNNPYRLAFEQLHHESVALYDGMAGAGFLLLIWLAWATEPDRKQKQSHLKGSEPTMTSSTAQNATQNTARSSPPIN